MGQTLPKWPKWLERALQGLAFWMGHRHSLFSEYPLTEGAMIAEAWVLIKANLPSNLILLPECMYKNLVPLEKANGNFGNSRADLVICENSGAAQIDRGYNLFSHVKFVIEVKRGSASRKEIDADLVRLYTCLTEVNSNARAFFFLVSERRAHPRFVRSGMSIRGKHKIRPDCQGHFRVRRTVKAAASFSGKKTANYVCLIEVFR